MLVNAESFDLESLVSSANSSPSLPTCDSLNVISYVVPSGDENGTQNGLTDGAARREHIINGCSNSSYGAMSGDEQEVTLVGELMHLARAHWIQLFKINLQVCIIVSMSKL